MGANSSSGVTMRRPEARVAASVACAEGTTVSKPIGSHRILGFVRFMAREYVQAGPACAVRCSTKKALRGMKKNQPSVDADSSCLLKL
jgi:hypothetical protein